MNVYKTYSCVWNTEHVLKFLKLSTCYMEPVREAVEGPELNLNFLTNMPVGNKYLACKPQNFRAVC